MVLNSPPDRLGLLDFNEKSTSPPPPPWQNRTEQNRTEQNRTEQSRADQSRADQSRAEQSRKEQNKNRTSSTTATATTRATLSQIFLPDPSQILAQTGPTVGRRILPCRSVPLQNSVLRQRLPDLPPRCGIMPAQAGQTVGGGIFSCLGVSFQNNGGQVGEHGFNRGSRRGAPREAQF